jgi:hypothetical protein
MTKRNADEIERALGKLPLYFDKDVSMFSTLYDSYVYGVEYGYRAGIAYADANPIEPNLGECEPSLGQSVPQAPGKTELTDGGGRAQAPSESAFDEDEFRKLAEHFAGVWRNEDGRLESDEPRKLELSGPRIQAYVAGAKECAKRLTLLAGPGNTKGEK